MTAEPLTHDLFESAPAPAPSTLRSASGSAPGPAPLTRSRPQQLWYAVVFAELPLHGTATQQIAEPLVVSEGSGSRALVVLPNAAARCLGLRPGLTLSAAHALVPGLKVVPRNSAGEARWLTQLAQYAQAFTSFVSLEPPQTLLLEVRGSVRLFGPLALLNERLNALWRDLGLAACSAVAPAALAALWLARAGRTELVEDPGALAGCLSTLPIAATAWNAECLHRLESMGLRQLGELMRLPRAGLARRLGAGVLEDLDQALARTAVRAAPRRKFMPRERFYARRDFESEIDSALYLEKALAPLIERCAAFLRTRQAGIQALMLSLRHRSRPATRLRLGFASVTGERRRLAAVLATSLAGLQLPAPVRSLELRSSALHALPGTSLDAFSRSLETSGGGLELIERLRARIGEEAVYSVCWVPEHRPEAAWRRVRDAETQPAICAALPPVAAAAPRPLWLLREPQALAERVELEQGPERIESGWWDGHDVARDYYVARNAEGASLWVYRERRAKGGWFLHGVFG